MDDRSYTIRVHRRWVRSAAIVGVTALIVVPLTAVATHTFTDVAETHTFHSDIAWLAEADVTKGCNPPANTRYCPNDFVTRGQMAAFMRRLAENQVVDAATLEGKTIDQLPGIAVATATGTLNTTSETWSPVAGSAVSFTQNTPAAAIVRFTTEGRADGDTSLWVRARIPGVGFGRPGLTGSPGLEDATVLFHNTTGAGTASMEWVFPQLPAGEHQVIVEWRRSGPLGNVVLRNRTTVVQFNVEAGISISQVEDSLDGLGAVLSSTSATEPGTDDD